MGIIGHFKDENDFSEGDSDNSPIKINDIIKKRTKGKYLTDIKTKDLYKFYINGITPIESISGGKTRGEYDLKEKEYSKILKDLNLEIIKLIILENFEFKIPCSLGTLSMKQSPIEYKLDEKGELNTKYLTADYKATRALWLKDEEARKAKKMIFLTNEHTNGYRMSYWWSKSGARIVGIAAYYFVACRQVKRAPVNYLKNKELGLTFYQKKKKP
jgi:hypothetical protein